MDRERVSRSAPDRSLISARATEVPAPYHRSIVAKAEVHGGAIAGVVVGENVERATDRQGEADQRHAQQDACDQCDEWAGQLLCGWG